MTETDSPLPNHFIYNSYLSLSLSLTHTHTHTHSQLNSDQVQNILALQSLAMSEYMYLFWPAVEWILQCVAYKATEVGRPLLYKCRYTTLTTLTPLTHGPLI